MTTYKYRVIFNKDGMEIEASGNSLREITEKTGLSKNYIFNRDVRDRENKAKKFNRKSKVILVEKKKIRYRCVKDDVEHEFNDLKQGALILGVSMPTVHRILKSDKLKEKHNISVIE